ncbi:MAG: cation:proton antiporter [Muribaculaceae bacterium]|jgi:monovalent cation:H+ antiporter-2, CPA2 family|nr:cation:proton antiporter [Muribaculaceae bacterium]
MILATATTALSIESLISDLAFILILGAFTTVFFKWIKQPVVLGYIVAGFLASPNFTYLPSVTTESNIDFWAQIGIIALLFSLGLEFSFKKLMNAGGSAVVTALIIMGGMMCAGFAIGHVLGFSNINCLFLGGMLSMSSTTIIIKAFNDLGIQHKKFASLVFAVLIVEDLFAVVMMVILSSIAVNNSVAGGEMLYSISKLVFFLVMWFLVGVIVLPSLLNRIRAYLNSETLVLVSMGLCLGMAVVSVMCGFSLALGAFVMGSILAGTSFAERIERVIMPIKDLFGSVFFISVGMMVNPDVIVTYAGPILALSAVVIVGMIVFGTSGMLITGQSLKVAMESGFSLTQIGEFAFIIATLGMSLGVLDSTIYPIVVAVSVLTTFTTPYFIRMADPAYNIVAKMLPRNLRFLINRYTTDAGTDAATNTLWQSVLRRYVWRILIYAAILITIVLLSKGWLLPMLTHFNEKWGRLICALVTLTAMSPFLFALAIPASKSSERRQLKNANSHSKVPLVVMTLFRLILALGFIVYELKSLYSWSTAVVCGIAVFILIALLLSNRIRMHLHNIEQRFMDNLNERELRRSGKNNNVIADLHLAFMTVGFGCPFVGERLRDSGLRQQYGVNVASIQRGTSAIPVPGGDVRIFPGDTLGVIGTDEQIQNLLKVVEAPENENSVTVSPHDIKLTSLQLTCGSPLLHKSVAESGLRNDYHSLLVSIARDGEFFTPDASTRFAEGDVLWIVGNPRQLANLA